MKKSVFILFLLFVLASLGAAEETGNDTLAQKTPEQRIAELATRLENMEQKAGEHQGALDKLAKLKLSGYMQTQWQLAESPGVPSVAGGNFPFNRLNYVGPETVLSHDRDSLWDTLSTRQRFLVRRARLKTTYDAGTSKFVLEVDVLPTGVSVKDANVSLYEPWLKAFSATIGIMDRPFGFEVPYSSSSLETPERSRMAQVVFPGEKDLGAKIEFNPGESMGLFQYVNLKGGWFTGMGGNNPGFNEVDDNLDFIGRAGFRAPFYALGLEIDGGASAYLGKVQDRSDFAISTKHIPRKVATPGDSVAVENTPVVTTGNKDKLFDRKLYGVDAQVYYDHPFLGGTSLRGEYLWGKMPGTLVSNSPYFVPGQLSNFAAFYTTPVDLFERKMTGWYVMVIQNIGKMVQAVVKYDVFDPNTDATGSDILAVLDPSSEAGAGTGNLTHLQTLADLKYWTLGFGLNYYWDENLRFTIYYDMVRNEKVNAANADTLYLGASDNYAQNPLAHYRDDLKDNVLTIRAQFKF